MITHTLVKKLYKYSLFSDNIEFSNSVMCSQRKTNRVLIVNASNLRRCGEELIENKTAITAAATFLTF